MGIFARLSHRVGNNLVRSGIVKEEDAEIYIYGINQIFVSVLNVSSALIIGLILGMFLESVVLMVAYIPLRSFAGGYHAKTPVRCYFASLFLIFAVLLFCKYVPYNLFLHGGMMIVSSLVIIFLCPVQDNNKPLDDCEHRKYKKISIIILLIEFLAWAVTIFTLHIYCYIIPIVLFVNSIMIVFGKIKNKLILKLSRNYE